MNLKYEVMKGQATLWTLMNSSKILEPTLTCQIINVSS